VKEPDVIDFGSIGVLKVAEIVFIASILTRPAGPLTLLRGSFVAPLAGEVRVTLGTIHALTIPGASCLQPPINTAQSKATNTAAFTETPTKRSHRCETVVIIVLVLELFINISVKL
jgi:hypothetical protein